MILRLLPNQITERWEAIRQAIIYTCPDDSKMTEGMLSNILISMMKGVMHCWLLCEGDDIYGLIVTTFYHTPEGEKSLCIYSIIGYKPIKDEMWDQLIRAAKQWAKANGCSRIIGYTDSKRILEIVSRYDCSVRKYFEIKVGG
jgi:hypothetical protein